MLFRSQKREGEQRVDTCGVKETVTIQHIRKGKVIATRHSDKITTVGLAELAKLFIATGTAFTALALGTGTAAAAASDTALGTEITAGGLARAAASLSSSAATATLEHTWTATTAYAVTEEGEFNAMSGGVIAARQVFAALNVVNTDEIRVTHKNAFAEG